MLRAVPVLLCLLAVFVESSRAADVPPGAAVLVSSSDFVPPQGDLLAHATQGFSIIFDAPPGQYIGTETTRTYQGTLSSSVFREASGYLAFEYDFTFDEKFPGASFPVGGEGSWLDLIGFGGTTTDVQDTKTASQAYITRSADGSMLSLLGQGPAGTYGPHHAVVRTSATSFDSGGSAVVSLGDEFGVSSTPGGGSTATGILSRDSVIPGTFRPVPEPTVLGAIMVLGGITALRRRKRA